MVNCRTCDKTPYISFNWPYASEGTDRNMAAVASNLRRCRALKFGHLYQCRQCELYWFLDDDGVVMHRVKADKNESLFAWADRQLAPTKEAIRQLKEIGATGPDQYGNGEIKVPCAIKTSSGELHDRALVLITKMPPIADWQETTLLGDAIASIARSGFALPMPVRLATLRADEIRMGFAPTRVQSKDGRYFVLNWAPSFFSYGPLVGKDISLCRESFRLTDEIPILSEDVGRIAYVYYDWYAGCDSLVSAIA